MLACQHFCTAVIVSYAKVARPEFPTFFGIQHVRRVSYLTIYRVSWPQSSVGNNRFCVIVEKQHKHLDPQKPVFLTFALSQNLPY